MATLEKIKVGDVLYDVHRTRAGNTTMTVQGIWEVYVKEVHIDEGYALCSWNGNPATKYFGHGLSKLRTKEPKKLNGHLQGCRKRGGLAWGEDCTCEGK